MSTRKAPDNSPLSQERYMSSPEYAELRGLSGNAVARKAAYLAHPRKRDLLFWLQAMSLRPGGLPKLADELIEAHGAQIGTPTLLRHPLRDDACYPPKLARQIDAEADNLLADDPWCRSSPEEIKRREETVCKRTRREWLDLCRESVARRMVSFLFELAINPKVQVRIHGESDTAAAEERERVTAAHDERDFHFSTAELHYFPNVVEALLKFQDGYAEKARQDFVMTDIARQVCGALDTALETADRIAVIEGREGVGKTEAAKVWCEQHLGEARFISLVGVSHKTGFFRALAKVLGLASSYARTATEMQARVEDVLQSSRLMLVIDEAHYLFGTGDRVYTQPELVNWIYTACTNFKVPVALVTTKQFGRKMRQAEQQVIWNAGQFERRVRPYVKLPDAPSIGELKAVARKQLAGATSAMTDLVAGYAFATKFPFTNLVDAISEARRLAQKAGRAEPVFEDLKRAVFDVRMPSDKAAAEAFTAQQVKGRRVRHNDAPEAGFQQPLRGDESPLQGTDTVNNFADRTSAERPRLDSGSRRGSHSLVVT